MRLLDLVEQHHRERPLANGVDELPAGVVAHVARRRADQPRIGVLGGELTHVEADAGLLVAEQQPGDGLGELRLADAGGAGEEQDAARVVARARGLRGGQPGHGALENVERLAHGPRLTLDRLGDFLLAGADLIVEIRLPPGVVGDAHAIGAHRIGDLRERQVLVPGDGADLHHGPHRQAVGEAREGVGGLGAFLLVHPGGARQVAGQPLGHGEPRLPVRQVGHDRADPVVADDEPRRQVGRPVPPARRRG